MPRKNQKNTGSTKATIKDYIDDMKAAPEFLWNKGKWSQCHGDNKSTSEGMHVTKTQISSSNPAEYLVCVCKDNVPVLQFSMGTGSEPTNEEVWERLKEEKQKAKK